MAKNQGRDLRLQVKISSVWTDIPTASDTGTISNETVDVTHQGDAPWRQLLANCGLRNGVISDNGFITDSSVFDYLHAQSQAGALIEARLTEGFWGVQQGNYQMVSIERNGEYNGAEMFSMSLESAGLLTKELLGFMLIGANTAYDPTVITTAGTVRWDFGDGSAQVISNSPTHVYSGTPDYLVTIFDVPRNDIISIFANSDKILAINLNGFTNLVELFCFTNDISILDVSDLTSLIALGCWTNNISILDVSNLTSLTGLYCHQNNISALDVSELVSLTGLNCSQNDITALDIENLILLTTLDCGTNDIALLDVSDLSLLTTLRCQINNISILDTTNLNQLVHFFCYNNNISILDISSMTQLQQFRCEGNNISTLDTSNLNSIISFTCSSNNISVLDVSGMTTVSTLQCFGNSISILDVSALTSLLILVCHFNNISVLNVSVLTSLFSLNCQFNDISVLDFSSLSLLKTIKADNNQLPSGQIDNMLIDLDGHGLTNGSLAYSNNAGNPTVASLAAYNSLISKGWSITGAIPA